MINEVKGQVVSLQPGGAIVSYQAAYIAMVECRASKELGERVGRVDDTRKNVGEHDFLICLPFLDREVLNVDVTRYWSGSA